MPAKKAAKKKLTAIPLPPAADWRTTDQKPALTPEQLARIATLRAFAAKKRKVADLLIASDLADEAGPHQQAAEKALAEARRELRIRPHETA